MTDFIEMLVTLMESRSSETYNAGSGRSVSIQDVVDTINRFLSVKKPISSTGIVPEEGVLDVAADIRKAWEHLRWRPTTTLEAGLSQMIDAPATTGQGL